MQDPKKALREEWRETLESVSYKKFLAAQSELAQYLGSFCREKFSSGTIAGFRARLEMGEAGIEALLSGTGALSQNSWAFPVAQDGGVLEFRTAKVPLIEKEFRKSLWDIWEPVSTLAKLDPQSVTLVLVPLLAFDKAGTRLGQGKGYYDRFLPKTKALRLGVAFSWQEAKESLPRETHDCPLDAVCTEKGIRYFKP